MSDARPGEAIPIPSVPNLRDLGGWPTRDGRTVRHGLAFRSTELARLGDADRTAFAALGLRTVIDLRTTAERTAEPDPTLVGVDNMALDVLADVAGAAPAQLLQVLADPAAAEEMLGGGRAVGMFRDGYTAIATAPSALAAYHDFFAALADANHRPVLFHCTTGKDRTGWGAATLLAILGVSDDDVMAEYLLTNDQLLPALQPMFDRFAAAGGDPALLRPVLGVAPDYLQAARTAVQETYGSFDGYLHDGLRLDAATLDRLRSSFLQD